MFRTILGTMPVYFFIKRIFLAFIFIIFVYFCYFQGPCRNVAVKLRFVSSLNLKQTCKAGRQRFREIKVGHLKKLSRNLAAWEVAQLELRAITKMPPIH